MKVRAPAKSCQQATEVEGVSTVKVWNKCQVKQLAMCGGSWHAGGQVIFLLRLRTPAPMQDRKMVWLSRSGLMLKVTPKNSLTCRSVSTA